MEECVNIFEEFREVFVIGDESVNFYYDCGVYYGLLWCWSCRNEGEL